MIIILRGERQEVTKILNWATDWPVLIEASTERVKKWEKAGHEVARRETGLVLMGTIRHFCIV